MPGPQLRRVAIDDDVPAYVSEGPELVAEAAVDEHSASEAEEDFRYEAHRLRREGWSTARIALELHASNDEVEAVLSDEDPNDDVAAYAYGTDTEEGADE